MPEYADKPHEGHGGRRPIDVYNTLPRAQTPMPSADMLATMKLKGELRTVHQIGIKLRGRLYWDDALTGLAGRQVTVRYDDNELESISVILDGGYLCEAEEKELLQMVDEDPEVLGAHIGKQKRQIRETRERIRKSSRDIFSDEVDLARAGDWTVTSLEYGKAARGRRRKRAELEAPREDHSGDAVRAMYARLGREQLHKSG
jgi:hypothetical protein